MLVEVANSNAGELRVSHREFMMVINHIVTGGRHHPRSNSEQTLGQFAGTQVLCITGKKVLSGLEGRYKIEDMPHICMYMYVCNYIYIICIYIYMIWLTTMGIDHFLL